MSRHEHRTDWRALLFYGVVFVIVLLVGGTAIWSFIERQALVIAPEQLPKVTIVTGDDSSKLAASWVSLLTKAEIAPTLVPLDHFNPIEGVVVFCDVPSIPPKLAASLVEFTRRGGVISYIGVPPQNAIGRFQLSADVGRADPVMKLSEQVSPVLARLTPGHELGSRPVPVAFLNENPRMTVDIRWRDSARAAAAHFEEQGSRVIWLGFAPEGLYNKDDRQLLLFLRTAFRWVAGQPVSDGAVGAPPAAKTLTPAARREAREKQFTFSVDRLPDPKLFGVRMSNRGKLPLYNPTVKLWLPPDVIEVKLAGDLIMKRNATLTGVPEEGAVLVSLPSLQRDEERVLKLKIAATRTNAPGSQ